MRLLEQIGRWTVLQFIVVFVCGSFLLGGLNHLQYQAVADFLRPIFVFITSAWIIIQWDKVALWVESKLWNNNG